MDRIVVGVDGSEASAAALRWAAEEARHAGATLVVLHAYLAPLAYTGPEEVIEHIDPELHSATMERLSSFVADAGADLAHLDVVHRLHPGRAADGLLAEARVADLLVVGNRGAGGFEGLLLGSTAGHCARHAACPVVVVPASLTGSDGRIVVGVDGSRAAEQALAWAGAAAQRRGLGLDVVGVYQPYDAHGPFGGTFMQIASPGSTARFRDAAAEHVKDALASVAMSDDVPVSSTVLAGHPAQVLVQRAASASLLVVGRRGGEGFSGLLLGSVGRQVLHHASCPVGIIPS